MKLTPVVLLLPVFIFYLDRSLREIPHALGVVLSVTWFLSALLNLGWGVYVSRQSTFQGFLCVAMGVVQILSVLVFPVIAAARMGT